MTKITNFFSFEGTDVREESTPTFRKALVAHISVLKELLNNGRGRNKL